jgi:type III pantothenate kinase
MILCDIGNTTADIDDNGARRKISLNAFVPEELDGEVWFASVNRSWEERLVSLPGWNNVRGLIEWGKYYPTMGIDRILVCEALSSGTIVDAGSAITVDRIDNGIYRGGMISLGLVSAQEAYARLSPALEVSFNFEVDLDKMAKNTQDAVTVGFLAPLITQIRGLGGPLYLTGGDAKILKRYLPEAILREGLVFEGMKKLIDKGAKC